MDTGIGKEGYSIIGQGKIEAVLSGKPQERRNLIEEAAGIVKYKYRKEEAQKKLSNTDENLIRINDILETYEERYEPLKIQSDKGIEFVKLSEELKKKEINYIIFSIDSIKDKVDKINENLIEVNNKIAILVLSSNNNKSDLQKLNDSIEKLDFKNSIDKQKLFDFKTKHNNTNSENDLLNEKMGNINSNRKKAQLEISILYDKKQMLNEQKNNNDTSIAKSKEKQALLEAEINDLNIKLNSINKLAESELSTLKDSKEKQIDYLSEISNCENDMVIIKNEIRNLDLKVESIKTSFTLYSENLAINEKKLISFEKKIIEIKSQIKKYNDLIENNKYSIVQKDLQLSKLDQKSKNLNVIISKMEAQNNMLENLEIHQDRKSVV